MLKRILSVCAAVCMALALCVPAFANGLPFEKVPEAPQKLDFLFSYPNEGGECIEAVFTVPDALSEIAVLSAENQQKYYGTVFETCVQFDWAVDDENAFHCDKTWDTVDGDYPIQKLTGSFVEQTELFWFTYDEAAERCAPGVITKENAVSTPIYDEEGIITDSVRETVDCRVFDFDKHELYVRARFFVYDYTAKTCTFSDWSETAKVGDAFREVKEPELYKGNVERPVLSKVQLSDQEGWFEFRLSFPDSVKEAAYLLKTTCDTELNLESQVRVNGGEWQYWIVENDLYPYLVGLRRFSVLKTDLENKLEYRCRLTGGNPDDGTALTTGWSDILTYENGEVKLVTNTDPFDEEVAKAQQAAAEKEANKCKVCGICPFHPFGVCMFIWIAILLVIMLIVLYNVRAHSKKKKREAEIKAREEASRATRFDKTESIFNTDRIQPNKKEEEEE